MAERRQRRDGLAAIPFLLPQLLGLLAFTVIPIVLTLWFAGTDYSLERHNRFTGAEPGWLGIDNLIQVLGDGRFWQALGNTAFLLMAVPIGMTCSLLLALALRGPLSAAREDRASTRRLLVVWAVACLAIGALLDALGSGSSGIFMLAALVGLLPLAGFGSGSRFYRGALYLPTFTAGFAVFIMWKRLFASGEGPVNGILGDALQVIATTIGSWPTPLVNCCAMLLCAMVGSLVFTRCGHLLARWHSGEIGSGSLAAAVAIGIGLPALAGTLLLCGEDDHRRWLLLLICLPGLVLVWQRCRQRREWRAPTWQAGDAALASGVVILLLTLAGSWAADALLVLGHADSQAIAPPAWLTDPAWSKPALLIVLIWLGVGSNAMLLYLAALSQVPRQLHEAATLDGANSWQRFWTVTWPHLAPTTVFVFVTGVIATLNGGFELVRAMTDGGPAWSTATVEFLIYREAFVDLRLGYAAAISLILAVITFTIALITWRIGERYATE